MKSKNIFSTLASRLNGPQSIGHSPVFWTIFLIFIVLLFCFPLLFSEYEVVNLTYFFSNLFLAMGLSLIWGCGDILSFGQMAFFGLGGYAYGIIGINLIGAVSNTNLAFLGGILIPMAFAAILGYFLFYGRVSGVYVTIITLVSTLVFETFMAQTAGPQWAIGKALLGGYNGMTNIPSIQLQIFGLNKIFDGIPLYYFVLILLIAVYFFLRYLVNSKYGNSLVATGSNTLRTEMLGYDIRLIQVIAFAIAGALAGLSGVIYVAWGHYITPSTMGLTTAALPVIWVAVGGRKSILATIISAVVLQYFAQYLSVTGSEYAFVILGALLMFVVMYVPQGVIPPIANYLNKIGKKRSVGEPVCHEEGERT
jgi:ABC-type branched-subunit amino acid transport system permease subunit